MPKYRVDKPYVYGVPRLETRTNDQEFNRCWLKGTKTAPSNRRTEPDSLYNFELFEIFDDVPIS